MFYLGLIIMIVGATMVYGTKKLSIKGGGFIIAVIGITLLFFNEVPKELRFLRFINF